MLLSVALLGFCISLYFQSGQTRTQSMSWDQYKSINYDNDRTHSLDELDAKLSPFSLEGLIQDIADKNRLAGEKTRIMEIGSGNGRLLMSLKKRFPGVEFYGINKEKTHSFFRRENYILTALKFEIMTKEELENIELPYVIFQDLDFGQSIPYNENKFDLVFADDVIRLVKYKFELMDEIMRILKPDGQALITDLQGLDVYSDGVILDQKEIFTELRRRGVDAGLIGESTSLRFKKNRSGIVFPVTPHQPIPTNPASTSDDVRRSQMGYNLK